MVHEAYPNHCQGCIQLPDLLVGIPLSYPFLSPLGLRGLRRGQKEPVRSRVLLKSASASSVSKSISALLLRQVISGLRFAVEWLKLPVGS